jgi:hypothetical protein
MSWPTLFAHEHSEIHRRDAEHAKHQSRNGKDHRTIYNRTTDYRTTDNKNYGGLKSAAKRRVVCSLREARDSKAAKKT